MAQFDVHRNPGQHREAIPYVVVVQSAIFDRYRRRVVVPLVKRSYVATTMQRTRLNPTFTVKAVAVVLHPLDIVSVPTAKLGKRIATLAEHGGKIIEALDELFTRVYD